MASKAPRTIAITGARSVIGRLLTERLAEKGYRIVVLDIEKPQAHVRFQPVNLVEPNCDIELEGILREERCQTIVHLAFISKPTFDTGYSHELQSIGTLNVLHAARSAGIRKIISISPSAIYGARGQNPNFLTEEHPIHPNEDYEYMMDRAEADQHVTSFMTKHKELSVIQLRIAPMLGPSSDTLLTRMLSSTATTTLLGYDPLFQFIHEEDAAEAVHRAVEYDGSGLFNIASDGVMPLSTILYHSGTVAVPLAHPIAYPLYHSLWVMRLNPIPSQHLDYLRYLCIVDGRKARDLLGFRPRFTTQGALLEHLGMKRKAA